MTQVRELIKTVKVVGLGPMLRLRRAHRLAWPGMINGYCATRVMQTLFNVGFFDELRAEGSVEVDTFAEQHHLDPVILQSLCESLYAFGVLGRVGPSFVLEPKGRLLAEVARGWFDGVFGYSDLFNALEEMLKKQQRYRDDVSRRLSFVARGSGEAEGLLYFPLAIDYIRERKFRKALDLGCGDGTFLRTLCHQVSGVTGCGVDISPEAIADGVQRTREERLDDRVRLFVEDISMLARVPEGLEGVEVATVFFVLHELLADGRDRVITFLRDFRRLFPKVPLMVFEVDRPTPHQMRRRGGMSIPYYLQHDLSQQRPIAKDEWRPIFEAAGFAGISERNLAFAHSVIFTLQ
jgi:SAM-dependent methyltransferase